MTLPSPLKPQTWTRAKVLLQLGIFIALAAVGWNYLGRDANDASKLTTQVPALSNADLIGVVETLRLIHPALADDPKTKALAELGRQMFFDPGFSSNNQIACASCHKPELSFTDGAPTAKGISQTAMNAPTLVNVYAGQWFFWNGRSDSLEAQAMGPVENPMEHGFSRVKIAYYLRDHYKKSYTNIFGPLPTNLPPPETQSSLVVPSHISDEIAAFALATLGNADFQKSVLSTATKQGVQPIAVLKNISSHGTPVPIKHEKNQPNSFYHLGRDEQEAINTVFVNYAKAIAQFERSIRSSHAPFDDFAASLAATKDVERSLSAKFGPSELRGLKFFTGRGQCLICHNGPYFSDQHFHNIGLAATKTDNVDLGRSQGMLIARDDPFNCRGKYLRQKKQTESCLELGYLETENADAVGAFKTPTLRQLKDSAPYGHDGRFATLRDVLLHYSKLSPTPEVGRRAATLRSLQLSEDELVDLEAFLLSLHGDVSYLK